MQTPSNNERIPRAWSHGVKRKEEEGTYRDGLSSCPLSVQPLSLSASAEEFAEGKPEMPRSVRPVGRSAAIRDGGLTTREPRSGLKYSNDGHANV